MDRPGRFIWVIVSLDSSMFMDCSRGHYLRSGVDADIWSLVFHAASRAKQPPCAGLISESMMKKRENSGPITL